LCVWSSVASWSSARDPKTAVLGLGRFPKLKLATNRIDPTFAEATVDMTMMGSTGWDAQEQALSGEDDFQQFLDIPGMGHIGDGLNFDFQGFQDASAAGMLNQGRREQMDTQMGGTDPSVVIPRTTGLVSDQMQTMVTAPGTMSLPAQIAQAPPTPTEAINEIDAQIQYLQQQRMQQQQRQLQEQQAAYYAPQSHGIPPTPQSLEMQPNNRFFSSTDAPMYENRARMKGQQQSQHAQSQEVRR
jgi:hypothetical protein